MDIFLAIPLYIKKDKSPLHPQSQKDSTSMQWPQCSLKGHEWYSDSNWLLLVTLQLTTEQALESASAGVQLRACKYPEKLFCLSILVHFHKTSLSIIQRCFMYFSPRNFSVEAVGFTFLANRYRATWWILLSFSIAIFFPYSRLILHRRKLARVSLYSIQSSGR